jgi:endoglycosylceramidase
MTSCRRVVETGFAALLALLATGLSACTSKSPGSAAAATCTVSAPTPSDWRLVADGTNFKDALGRVVFLRGVAAGGRSKFAPYVPFDYPPGGYATALAAYMDHAASWGIDVMRVPFTWAALEPNQGTNDADWLSRYDQLLDAAWARGIWTVIDFHQDIYAEPFCGDGFPAWTIPYDAGPPVHDCANWSIGYFQDQRVTSAFDRFWDAGTGVQAAYGSAWDVMIARYKDKPGVLGFEPINEPGWGSEDESMFTATTLTAFYSTIVPHMRAAAPTSLVFIDPPGLDGTSVSTTLGKPTGDGIVFAPHYYPVSTLNAQPATDLVAWQTIGQTWNVPVFLGEFGASNAGAGTAAFASSVFDALDTLSLSGTEWEYSIESELWNKESFSLVAADGGEYPVAKSIQRPYARAVAGSAIAQAFDAMSGTFTLTFKPTAGGVTEVAVPATAYPTGYDSVVTGGCASSGTGASAGRLLIQPAANATSVSLKITPK